MDIFKSIIGEMQKSLPERIVMGDPITVAGITIVPLVSIDLAFGAGLGVAGSGVGKEDTTGGGGGGGGGDGSGGGGGGGGGDGGSGGGGSLVMEPVAVIIIDQNGVRVEQLKSTRHSLAQENVAAVPRIATPGTPGTSYDYSQFLPKKKVKKKLT
jgi:uncharacterized spore protein YtfJ